MRLAVVVLSLSLLAASACNTSRKVPCPTDEAKGGLFGLFGGKKSNSTAAMQKAEGQGDPEESATAAQADAGRSIGGGGYKTDKKGLVKRKKYKNLKNRQRTGQRSFLGLTF